MRILETDMGERKMDKKNQQDRMGKPSGAFYRAEDHLTIQLLPQKGNEELLAGFGSCVSVLLGGRALLLQYADPAGTSGRLECDGGAGMAESQGKYASSVSG